MHTYALQSASMRPHAHPCTRAPLSTHALRCGPMHPRVHRYIFTPMHIHALMRFRPPMLAMQDLLLVYVSPFVTSPLVAHPCVPMHSCTHAPVSTPMRCPCRTLCSCMGRPLLPYPLSSCPTSKHPLPASYTPTIPAPLRYRYEGFEWILRLCMLSTPIPAPIRSCLGGTKQPTLYEGAFKGRV